MDLKSMVVDLIDLGMSQAEIGKAIGRSQSTVSDIAARGLKRPPHETVEALKKFHAAQMKARKAA